jgi:hypothetical protein
MLKQVVKIVTTLVKRVNVIADPTFDYCLSQGFCGLLVAKLSKAGIRLLSRWAA